MSDQELDVEQFIDEVRKRPVIWDVGHEDYKNRLVKQSAWESICKLMIENFNKSTPKEKQYTIRKVALKWKNLKDNFSRNIRKRAKSGGEKPIREYIYSSKLSFLQDPEEYFQQQDEKNVLLLEMADSSPTTVDPSAMSEPHHHDKRKVKLQLKVESPTKFINSKNNSRHPLKKDVPAIEMETTPATTVASSYHEGGEVKHQQDVESLMKFINSHVVFEPDEDRSFFDSIMPTIRSFNEDQKLDFRCEVLNLIKQIKCT